MPNNTIKYCIAIESTITYETQLRSKFFDKESKARKWFKDNIIMFMKDSKAFIHCVIFNETDCTYSVYSSEDIY